LPDRLAGILAGRVALVCGATGPVGTGLCNGLATLGAGIAAHCQSSREQAELLVAGPLGCFPGLPSIRA
jgi:NAD(P)-dependent dehydrogenase (short-subunit alcohol dehydrogenase family)